MRFALAQCVGGAKSAQALVGCLTPKIEECFAADDHATIAPCLVAATDRLREATDAAFMRFKTAWTTEEKAHVVGIGLLLVQKKQAIGEVECRFQEKSVSEAKQERPPLLDPAENRTLAGRLYEWEVSALRALLSFVGEDGGHVS